jgi:small subunit ribosomal protein S6
VGLGPQGHRSRVFAVVQYCEEILRDYELVLVVKPDGGDDGFTATVERFSQAIKDQGGEVTNVDPWGLRKLAYPIDRHMEGFYSVTAFKIEPGEVRALEDNLGRAEDVLRHMVVRQDHAPVVREEPSDGDESREAEVPVAAEALPDGGESPKAEGPAAEASPDGGESPKAEGPVAEASSDGGESPKAEGPAAEASPASGESPEVEVAVEAEEAEVTAGTREESGDVGA